jgi:predicted kinase
MAILVDELREYPGTGLPFRAWCHMATDGTFEELHEFAARLGLRRAWFQRDHYDLPAHGRAAALALGAEEVATGELLLRMAGPRGERARRRVMAPAGVTWLRGRGGPSVLRYPAGALVVIGGPPGAGKSTLAARAVDGAPVLEEEGDAQPDRRSDLRAALAAGGGAVAVTTALRSDQRRELAGAAAAAGVAAHLLLLDADADACRDVRSGDRVEQLLREWEAFRRTLASTSAPAPFESIAILDRDAANRVRRLYLTVKSSLR